MGNSGGSLQKGEGAAVISDDAYIQGVSIDRAPYPSAALFKSIWYGEPL